jgi:medium-chain acyl-[acyl-carrier-protein] hydrolase
MLRLFCFSFAGGSVSSFAGWRKQSDNGFEVCPIEYPGRGSRFKESGCGTLAGLVEIIAVDLRSELQEPYALLGHSFGAIVAFELTRLLKSSNAPMPVRLFISAIRAPHLPQPEKIHDLPEREFLAKLKSYDGVPQEALQNSELLSLVVPVIRDDFRLYEQHVYQNDDPLPVPISVLGGSQDTKVPAADLMAWSQHTHKSFRCHFFPGGHFFLYEPRFSVMKDIKEDINASIITQPSNANK